MKRFDKTNAKVLLLYLHDNHMISGFFIGNIP